MSDGTLTLRGEGEHAYQVAITGAGVTVAGHAPVTLSEAPDGSLRAEGPPAATLWAVRIDEVVWVFLDGQVFTFTVDRPSSPRRRAAADDGPIVAPMPATVRRVVVAVGERVGRGTVLAVLEAMKMELPVRASADGVVRAIHCREGDVVQAGQRLLELGATPEGREEGPGAGGDPPQGGDAPDRDRAR